MLRLLSIAFVYALVVVAHLRKDRRKGSHPQKSHGSWSPNNSFTSKRAASRAKRSGGGRLSIRAKRSGDDSKARNAAQGRKIAEASRGTAGVTETPNPEDKIDGSGATEKQAAFLKSLLGKNKPMAPGSEPGVLEYGKKEDTKNQLLDYGMLLNAPQPKDSRESSKLIDDLKSRPNLSARDLDEVEEDPDEYPDWYPTTVSALQQKYGEDMSGLSAAITRRWNTLSDEQRKFIIGGQPGGNEKFRRLVLNPLLTV